MLDQIVGYTHMDIPDYETGMTIRDIKINQTVVQQPPDNTPGEVTVTYVGYKDDVKYEVTRVFDKVVCEGGELGMVERGNEISARISRGF